MGRIIDRRRVMGGRNLPYDAEIEYLESSGTQYIETDILPNSKMRAQCAFLCNFNNTAVFGSRDYNYVGSKDFDLIAYDSYNNGILWRFNSNNITFNKLLPFAYKRYDIDMGNTYCIIDGHEYLTATTIPWQAEVNTLTLFARKVPNIVLGVVSIFYFKLLEEDNILLDLIPVRVGNVGYMYDKVSGQLFGNSGTGAFILGPDK